MKCFASLVLCVGCATLLCGCPSAWYNEQVQIDDGLCGPILSGTEGVSFFDSLWRDESFWVLDSCADFFDDGTMAVAMVFGRSYETEYAGWYKRQYYVAVTTNQHDLWGVGIQPLSLYFADLPETSNDLFNPADVAWGYSPGSCWIYSDQAVSVDGLDQLNTLFSPRVRMKIDGECMYMAVSFPATLPSDTPAPEGSPSGCEYEYNVAGAQRVLAKLVRQSNGEFQEQSWGTWGVSCGEVNPYAPLSGHEFDLQMDFIRSVTGDINKVAVIGSNSTSCLYQEFENSNSFPLVYENEFVLPRELYPWCQVALAAHPSGVGVAIGGLRYGATANATDYDMYAYYTQYDGSNWTSFVDIGQINVGSSESPLTLQNKDLHLGDLIVNPGDQSFALVVDVVSGNAGLMVAPTTTFLLRKTWGSGWYVESHKYIANNRYCVPEKYRSRACASPAFSPYRTREWVFCYYGDKDSEQDVYAVAVEPTL